MSRPPKRTPGWPNPNADSIAAAQSGGSWQGIVDNVCWQNFDNRHLAWIHDRGPEGKTAL